MKIKIKGFIQIPKYRTEPQFSSVDMSEYGYIHVSTIETEVDFDMPAEFNPVAAQVVALEKKLDKMADEYHRNVKQVKDQIAELQCIDYEPSSA